MVVLYGLLGLGALTTLYPFAVMATTGLKGPTDQNDTRLIPTYLMKDEELFAKYVDDKYAGEAALIASARVGADASPEEVARYDAFLRDLPQEYWTAGFRMAPNGVTSRLRMRYQAWLRNRYPNIEALNKAYVEENVGFQTIDPPAEMPERRAWSPPDTRKYREWREFKASLPPEFRIPVRTQRMFQEFVRSKYHNVFADVPKWVVGKATKFEELEMPRVGLVIADPGTAEDGDPIRLALLVEFHQTWLPERYQAATAEDLWEKSAPTPNAGRPTPLPIIAHEKAQVAKSGPEMRREFATRNFAYVLDYILLNGRAVWNTTLFCLLAIATQLIVNPLAAYALSRYPIKSSGKILVFLLATMAFPAEVAMIPAFLLLKDLGLLEHVRRAGPAHGGLGYMIFLLKGFFDSLPQELFEAGQLDGAKEVTLMFKVALPSPARSSATSRSSRS